jgi:hypothetical protein
MLASPVPMRITGERQSPSPTRLPEKVSPNTDTSVPLGAITDAPRSAQVKPHRSVIPGPGDVGQLAVFVVRGSHRGQSENGVVGS